MNRRTFLKVSGAGAAGSYIAYKIGFGGLAGLETVEAAAPSSPVVEEWVPSTCSIGKQECGILARRINGRVVKIEGHPDYPRNQGRLCPKGIAQISTLYDPNRLKTPLVRTNAKGVPGEWRTASWDDALAIVGNKIRDVRARDPRLLVWQKGRSKSETLYDGAFAAAVGATKFGHGAYCSDAGYRAAEYTTGLNGVLHPDMKYVNYLLSWGWNITNAGGNKYCWITWNRQLLEAKTRGLKVVQIDPRARGAGPHADEWVPMRPSTDLAFALALANVIVADGVIDREYLAKYTNAPYLVGDDGLFLTQTVKVTKDGKDTDVAKELVWDSVTGAAVPFDTTGAKAALEGSYDVGDKKTKTSFELYKAHVATYTPEWASDVCGVPADTIRRIARELVNNAHIGSTIVVDGVTLPYRPVGIMAYHMAQQEHGFQAVRAMLHVMMLLGAVEAVGGQRSDFKWKLNANFTKFGKIAVNDPPYNIGLASSKYFPINSMNPGVVATVLKDPAKYGVNYAPEVLMIHMSNPTIAYASQPDIESMLGKYKFIVDIDLWMSRTADRWADVVLPASSLEKYEGPNGVDDTRTDATTVKLPLMEPLFDSRGELDIYLGIAEKAGVLYGDKGYVAEINKALSLKDLNALPTDKKPTSREVFDAWAKAQGLSEGIAYFEKNGVQLKGAIPAKKYYGTAQTVPFDGAVQRLYGQSLLQAQRDMKAKGADEIYWRDYNPFPVWRAPTMDSSPAEYDLYLISYKRIEYKQGRSSQQPLLAEIAPEQFVEINPKTAAARGIADGSWVIVESHNAITGEKRQLKVRAAYREGIRPDTVGMPHHFGGVAKHTGPVGIGATPNQIFFTGEGYVGMTADQAFQVKVRVFPAGGEA